MFFCFVYFLLHREAATFTLNNLALKYCKNDVLKQINTACHVVVLFTAYSNKAFNNSVLLTRFIFFFSIFLLKLEWHI